MNSLKIVRFLLFIPMLIDIACSVPYINEKYISCEWILVCGKNPLDKNCEYCELYLLDASSVDSEGKLEQYKINVHDGTVCNFIKYYENQNKLYFFPKNYDKALTIYFDDFSEQILCVEYSRALN